MALAKRVFFFLLTNFLIMIMLSIVMFLLRPVLESYGISLAGMNGLMIWCLLWGMGGSFISLWISKWIAKRSMGVQIIDPNTHDPQLRELVDEVHQLARTAGISGMPEVGIYQSPEVNAFATGPSRNNSLVAVSTGLLNNMRKDEVHGVLGHEVAHIANGDMVTMTLLQGIVNAFVMFISHIILNFIRGDRDDNPLGFFAEMFIYIFIQSVLLFLASIPMRAFSRWREYRADAGGAQIAGRDRMISALQALQRTIDHAEDPHHQEPAFAQMKISSGRKGLMTMLFATHPPLEDRIARLEQMNVA